MLGCINKGSLVVRKDYSQVCLYEGLRAEKPLAPTSRKTVRPQWNWKMLDIFFFPYPDPHPPLWLCSL